MLAGASVTKLATVLGVSRVTVSKVMLAYMNHGKTSVRRNSGQKSTLAERDHCTLRRIVSKNHRTTTVQMTAELNIHLEDPVSTKTDMSFTDPTSAVGLHLITESIAQMCKRWCQRP
jgi:transposase